MKIKRFTYPLVKVPSDMDVSLYLIKQELKCRKLFHILQEAGMNDSDFEPSLDSLILQSIGLDEDDENVWDKYDDIMENRSKKIVADQKVIMKQTFKAYHDLTILKKEIAKKAH